MSSEIVPTTSDELHAQMEYAKALAVSDLLPKAFVGKPANVLVAIEYGKALGIEPMAAIQGIQVINGKPTASAQLVGALVRRAGHTLRVAVQDNGSVEATVIRSDDPDFTFRAVWTMDRAKSAGLTGKGGSWATFPVAMLKARAITEVARDACPEVLAGVAYTAEELEPSGPGGRPVAVPPLPQPVEPASQVDTVTGELLDVEVLEPGDE